MFIHCKRGSDRTGTVVACYRISKEGWTDERAITEARQYGMSRILDGSGYCCIADLAESLCASNSAQQDGGRYNRFPHCYPPYKANKGNHLPLQLWRDYGQRRKVCQSFAGESKPRSGVKSLARGASPRRSMSAGYR